jgi:glycine hydroxymethyltransferase
MLKNNDPKLADMIAREKTRQLEEVELIASENYVTADVLEANGSILTNKYSE